MSEVRRAPLASHVPAAIRYGSLAAGVAATILFAYGQVLPLPRGWDSWPPWLLLGCLAGLALTRGCSPGEGGRARARASVAFALGLASATLGFGAILLIGCGFGARMIEEDVGPQTFLYQVTHWRVAGYLLGIALFIAVPGALGLWAARREGRPQSRASLAAAAARFSLCGLGSAGLIVVSLAVAMGFRWVLWG
jgi:hypothetical protein